MQNSHTQNAEPAGTGSLTPEIASGIRDFFLTMIAAEHLSTRAITETIPKDKLDFRPSPACRTIGQMLWEVFKVEHIALAGICDGEFKKLDVMPESKTPDAILQWDEDHFPKVFKRLVTLDGADLLRTVQIGSQVVPVVQYLATYTSMILQLRAQLGTYLTLAGPQQIVTVPPPAAEVESAPEPKAEAMQLADDELSEEELAGVVGGTTTTTTQQILWISGSELPANAPGATYISTSNAGYTAPTLDYGNPFSVGTLFAANDPAVKKIEGYLVTAAAVVVTAGTLGAFVGGALVAGTAVGSIGGLSPLLGALVTEGVFAGTADALIATNPGGSLTATQTDHLLDTISKAMNLDPLIATVARNDVQLSATILANDLLGMASDPNFANSSRIQAEVAVNNDIMAQYNMLSYAPMFASMAQLNIQTIEQYELPGALANTQA